MEWQADQNLEEVKIDLEVPQPAQMFEAPKPTRDIIKQISGTQSHKAVADIENPEQFLNPHEQCIEDALYTPIAALTSNNQDWIIKVRVSKKYERKSWNN